VRPFSLSLSPSLSSTDADSPSLSQTSEPDALSPLLSTLAASSPHPHSPTLIRLAGARCPSLGASANLSLKLSLSSSIRPYLLYSFPLMYPSVVRTCHRLQYLFAQLVRRVETVALGQLRVESRVCRALGQPVSESGLHRSVGR